MALKSTAKYYDLDLEVHQEYGRWSSLFRDPHKQKSVTKYNNDSSKVAAEGTALSAAHAYLIKEYPDQSWPAIRTNWLDASFPTIKAAG